MPRLLLVWCFAITATTSIAVAPIEVPAPAPDAIDSALQQIREKRARGDQSPQTVVLQTGIYRINRPIELSGTMIGDGIRFQCKTPGKSVVSGATELETGHKSEGHWRYSMPTPVTAANRPRVILVDGKLSSPARHPNVGYHRIESAASDRRSGFRFFADDIPSDLDVAAAPCDLVFLHDWSSSRLPVATIDFQSRQLATVGPIGCEANHYAIDHFEKQPRYFLEGHAVFADLPAEWYIDLQTQELVVVAGKEDKAPLVEIPLLEHLVVAGTDDEAVSGLFFDGIQFTGTRFPMPDGGLAGAQATMHEPRDRDGARTTTNRPLLSAAVQIDRSSGCVFLNCGFNGIGNTALWPGSRSNKSTIKDCTFSDIGGNAINVGEDNGRRVEGRSWYQSAPHQVPSDNQIVNCKISRCGAVLPGSVAIWAALNRRLEISQNTISDCPYTGISLGWLWNDSVSPAKSNRVHHNKISRVMQVLSDGAGIYTLGRQPDSELSFNTIDNVPLNAGRAESNGMFLDQGSTGFVIKENEFRRIAKSPVRFHQAGANTVQSNRWELETDQTPTVRYNNTPEDKITVTGNQELTHQKRIFLIGNSLTWDTRPPLLDDYVDWHVDCGKSLQFIHDHPANPCVDSSKHWPVALQQLQYDYLCVQPHYGTNVEQDVDVISHWMTIQPGAIVVIHSGWAREVSATDEFQSKDDHQMTHSPVYFNTLIDHLQTRFPNRNIRQTFATDSLNRVAQDIESGKAPLENLSALYRDAIHMTHGEGRYLMHNLMRVAVDQPPSDSGFSIREQNAKLKRYFDKIVESHRRTASKK